MAAFIQEEKCQSTEQGLVYNGNGQRKILLEHSNSKDIRIGSRTHVLGDICFMNFNTVSLVTLSNPHKGVPEKRLKVFLIYCDKK